MTMTLISTITVGSGGAASIDFNSIPQTYTDLQLLLSVRASSTSGDSLLIKLNGSTSNFTYRLLEGDTYVPNVASYSGSTGRIGFMPGTDYAYDSGNVYIPNYAGSTNKSISAEVMTEKNDTRSYQDITAMLWSNTAAITSLSLSSPVTFGQYSTASLYGILKGSGGATVS